MRVATCFVMLFWCLLRAEAQVFVKLPNSQAVVHSYYGMNGAGGSLYDWDKDGFPDITLCRNGQNPLFYHNEGGTFSQVPSFFSNSGDLKTIQWVDFDNDGDPDLSVSRMNSPFVIYVNDGNLNFSAIGPELGLPSESWLTYGHSWGDYDRDGDLDLYICNYDPVPPVTNHLLRNNGDGSFTDVTDEAGVSDGSKYSFQAVWCDFNFDGWQDLYVINDKVSPNSFYLNNGDGTFADYSAISQSNVVIEAMTNSVADYDNDGDFDIYITNTGADNVLLRAVEPLLFEDATQEAGLELNIMSWGAVFFDYDNNGLQDIFITTEIQPNKLFTHHPDHTFTSVTIPMTESGNYSYAPLEGDVNNDGLTDLVIASGAGTNTTVWRNETPDSGHYLKLDLHGTISNRDAIGSIVEIYAQENSWRKVHTSSINYLAQNAQYLHFGLGTAEILDSLVIRWPSGFIETHYNLVTDQFLAFTEGETLFPEIFNNLNQVYCEGDSTSLTLSGNWMSVHWNTGEITDTLTIASSGIYWANCVHAFGFEVTSDTVSIDFHPLPQAESIVSGLQCFADSSGSISLLPVGSNELFTFSWSTGDTNNVISNLVAGNYFCTLTDSFGCGNTFEFVVTQPDTLILTTISSFESLENDGWIEWSVQGGTEPFEVFLNTTAISGSPITGLAPGEYLLQITDGNGCVADTTLILLQAVFVEDLKSPDQHPWPNPFHDVVHLPKGLPEGGRLIVRDLSGRIVFEKPELDQTKADLSQLSPGIFLFQWSDPTSKYLLSWRLRKTD